MGSHHGSREILVINHNSREVNAADQTSSNIFLASHLKPSASYLINIIKNVSSKC